MGRVFYIIIFYLLALTITIILSIFNFFSVCTMLYVCHDLFQKRHDCVYFEKCHLNYMIILIITRQPSPVVTIKGPKGPDIQLLFSHDLLSMLLLSTYLNCQNKSSTKIQLLLTNNNINTNTI